jgi:ketosteroid isomerase-like protein
MRNGRSGSQFVEQSIGTAPSEEQALTRMEVERLKAIRQGHADALERIYAPEYTAVFSLNPGNVVCKVQELALQGPESRHLHLCELRDMKIRIYGNVGLVTGLASVQDVLRGQKRHIHSQYTHIWVKREGSWQLVHRHVNRVATSERPHSHNLISLTNGKSVSRKNEGFSRT